MALPKRYRLTRSREFSKVYQKGRQASGCCLVVKALRVSEQSADGCSRFGITISQKVSKRAVVRNRLKRQVRAALQELLPNFRAGLWIVVVLRTSSVQCDYWQFLQELEKLFLELEVFDGH
ncbi:ribonuclease P protein component [Oscillatoria sp. CS-180]|uniref:ribonuclease P protein component n=1 Tax=Oscillatoria sp. CS-180 TaxID=3021720 RepID=UPI002330C77D|nr:ribonuclease P protein component [Oscillatoria sp. CS-180]MDB9528211.1 ribonuclease P protein component [Oscillatoria sp. CS-180]